MVHLRIIHILITTMTDNLTPRPNSINVNCERPVQGFFAAFSSTLQHAKDRCAGDTSTNFIFININIKHEQSKRVATAI